MKGPILSFTDCHCYKGGLSKEWSWFQLFESGQLAGFSLGVGLHPGYTLQLFAAANPSCCLQYCEGSQRYAGDAYNFWLFLVWFADISLKPFNVGLNLCESLWCSEWNCRSVWWHWTLFSKKHQWVEAIPIIPKTSKKNPARKHH